MVRLPDTATLEAGDDVVLMGTTTRATPIFSAHHDEFVRDLANKATQELQNLGIWTVERSAFSAAIGGAFDAHQYVIRLEVVNVDRDMAQAEPMLATVGWIHVALSATIAVGILAVYGIVHVLGTVFFEGVRITEELLGPKGPGALAASGLAISALAAWFIWKSSKRKQP